MGWNTSALFVRDRTPESLLSLLTGLSVEPVGEVDAEEATSSFPADRVYTQSDGSWSQLWDPSASVVLDPETLMSIEATEILLGTVALVVLVHSTSSTYGYWYYEDGALVRCIVYSEGEVAEEIGDPLPAETAVEPGDLGIEEDYIFSVAHALTGQTLDLDTPFAAYAIGSPTA